MFYNTDNTPIKLEYWYIISFGNFLRLTLYPVYFVNKVAAKKALTLHVGPAQRGKYQIIKGEKLKQYYFNYRIRLGVLWKFTKYDYPEGITKKNYRTITRRRLRRMGMLTLIKPKLHIKKPVKQNRLINNRQKVSNSPYSAARIFSLQRKPKMFRYVILKKEKSKSKGKLFDIRAIRINLKDLSYKKVTIGIMTKDVITPYIMQEILETVKPNNKLYARLIRYSTKRNIPLHKRTPQNLS